MNSVKIKQINESQVLLHKKKILTFPEVGFVETAAVDIINIIK